MYMLITTKKVHAKTQTTTFYILCTLIFVIFGTSLTHAQINIPEEIAATSLSDDEYLWLAAHPTIQMGIDAGYGPYSFVDQDGTVRGVAIDFLELISEQLGIRFELISDKPWKDLIAAIQNKEIDAIATVSFLPERTEFLEFTDNYLVTPLVIMTKEESPQLKHLNELEAMQIALVQGYSSSKKLLKQYPDIKPHYVLNPSDGLNSVVLGLADAYVGVLGVNEYIAKQNGISGLKINASFDMKDNAQAIGVRKDWAPLASILNKTLKSIPEDQRQKIFDKWLPVQAGNIQAIVEPNKATQLFPLLLLLFFIAASGYLLVFKWNKQLQKKLDIKLAQLTEKNQQIDQLNSFLNAMVEASTDAIFIKDNNGVYQLANNALSYLLDKPISEIVGSTDYDLFPKELAEKFREDDKKIIHHGSPKTYEEDLVRADGEHIPFLTTKGPININDALTGVFGIARDISEIKLAIQLLEKSRDDLEQQVNIRTNELKESNFKLQQANKELALVNKELETFTYSVSHDLKAPLRGIDGYSKLLLEDHAEQLNDEGKTFINNLRQSAESMSKLIDDLLSYSRIERRSLQCNIIKLLPLIERVLEEYKSELVNIDFKMNITPIEFKTDPQALTLILRNLLGNAIKFSKNTLHPEISISAIQSEQQLLLTIQDNGIGFDMQFHDRIFDIFQRLQRSEDYPGTGIGLAISLKAAQRLGGTLHAESKPGKGATFFLEFPIS